jgi:hypothetical protein
MSTQRASQRRLRTRNRGGVRHWTALRADTRHASLTPVNALAPQSAAPTLAAAAPPPRTRTHS